MTQRCECGQGDAAEEHHPWCESLWSNDHTHEDRASQPESEE